MNKNTGVIIGIIALVLIGGGVYASMSYTAKMNQEAVLPEETMVKGEEITQENRETREEVSAEKMNVGSYEAYSAEKIVRAETEDVVLFFHAPWCPSFRGLNTNIESNLNAIPEGVTILKTDYDSEVELKKKYGVTYQHTFVQVDKEGNMIKKWSGGSTLQSVLSQLQ